MICADEEYFLMSGHLYMVKIDFFFQKFANQMSMVLKVFQVTLSKNENLFAPQAKILV